MEKKIRVGIIGATGYAGVELLRILSRHTLAEVVAISSVSFEGKEIWEVYPSFCEISSLVCTDVDEVIEKSDVIFAALPHGFSQETAFKVLDQNKKFIDLGADFRLEDEKLYKEWYDGKFAHKELHEKAVYGLPEFFRDKIKNASLISNPGCYPTSACLGIGPAIEADMIEDSIIIDAKSGVTGAGRNATGTTHFPFCNEGFSAYSVASHRHTPEIEQTLSFLGKKKTTITFVPHLLPVNRGIFSTIYAKLKSGISLTDVKEYYDNVYEKETFVRVLPDGVSANIKYIQNSNYCDIQLYEDKKAGLLIVTSALDNMVKGAAGQAVQNMNIICGIDEALGIDMIPTTF